MAPASSPASASWSTAAAGWPDYDGEVTVAGALPSNPRGEALLAELRWVHDVIRRSLGTVGRLADAVRAGHPAERVRAGVKALGADGAVVSLRLNCLSHCRFVHAHHGAESHLLFPAVRRTDPALGGVVDRLEADHRAVAGLLEDVEAAADMLVDRDTAAGRGRVADALAALADLLLGHLAYEEEQLAPVLRSWDRWPAW